MLSRTRTILDSASHFYSSTHTSRIFPFIHLQNPSSSCLFCQHLLDSNYCLHLSEYLNVYSQCSSNEMSISMRNFSGLLSLSRDSKQLKSTAVTTKSMEITHLCFFSPAKNILVCHVLYHLFPQSHQVLSNYRTFDNTFSYVKPLAALLPRTISSELLSLVTASTFPMQHFEQKFNIYLCDYFLQNSSLSTMLCKWSMYMSLQHSICFLEFAQLFSFVT